MYILRALLPIFIALPGCIKKKEASQSEAFIVRETLDLPNDEDLEDDKSLPECGDEDE